MDTTKVKPIPKYIVERIKKMDLKNCPEQCGAVRFYSYFTKYDKELAQVTVAVKTKNKKWYCKQVAVHGIHSENCIVKDMEFFFMGGYVVGWYNEGLTNYKKWYESDIWYEAKDKYYFPYSVVVNKEYLSKFEEYKYSGVEQYKYCDIFKFLRIYEKYPQAEFLVKFGLYNYATSITLLRLIGKDKKFRTWLISHSSEMALHGYYVSTITNAYKKNKDLVSVQQYEALLKTFSHNSNYKKIKELFNGKLDRFFDYIVEQHTNENSYIDYLNACEYLGLDLSLDKNKMPHDFKRWHDIRIDEYHTAKLKADEEQRKEFYAKFIDIAKKYMPLQRDNKDNFVCIIAKSPSDLIHEGDILHHCVGRMNYDQKFVREESLIFFIRNKETPDIPLVTVEYSPTKHKVLQCYGEHDSKPSDDIMNYVSKTWLPYANRKIKKLQIAA